MMGRKPKAGGKKSKSTSISLTPEARFICEYLKDKNPKFNLSGHINDYIVKKFSEVTTAQLLAIRKYELEIERNRLIEDYEYKIEKLAQELFKAKLAELKDTSQDE